MQAAFNWNQLHLLPSEHICETASKPITELHMPPHSQQQQQQQQANASGNDEDVPLTTWEAEAIRRYRALRVAQPMMKQCVYDSSTTTHHAVLQLVLHARLLPIGDWHKCAQRVAKAFQGPTAAPLSLLSHTIVNLATSHQLTPRAAAEWIVDVGFVLLGAEQTNGVVSPIHWAIAEELTRAVFALQTPRSLLFSSILLDAVFSRVLCADTSVGAGMDAPCWGLLTFGFLVRQHENFVFSEWSRDEQRRRDRIQKLCELGPKLPLHIAVILSAVA